jgi:hypothetical protein
VTKTWDILVIPKRGEIFRKKFAHRPELVMVLNRVQRCSPERAECYVMPMMVIDGQARLPSGPLHPAMVEQVTFRLHMTDLGMAYVEAER